MNILEAAKDLAHRAHDGQVDKAGRPYIEHVARVARAVSDDPKAEAVAWLHDVFEDCGTDYCRELIETMPGDIAMAAADLTRPMVGPDPQYYPLIRRNPLALRVKLADIADNADEARLALLDDKTAERLRRKYTKAVAALTEAT